MTNRGKNGNRHLYPPISVLLRVLRDLHVEPRISGRIGNRVGHYRMRIAISGRIGNRHLRKIEIPAESATAPTTTSPAFRLMTRAPAMYGRDSPFPAKTATP